MPTERASVEIATDERVIADQWAHLLGSADLSPAVARMLRVASARPAVRRRFPYLSLGTHLKLSARSEYPYSAGYPYLVYIDPTAVTDGPAFELRSSRHVPILRGDLDHLIDLLVALLPADGAAESDDDPPPPVPTWSVWRQDDNGARARITTGLARSEADAICTVFEARGHKQLYWVAPDEEGSR